MMSSSKVILLRQCRVWRGRRAFTLVELMVAVALVLVLILGVNEVFRLTSDTINVGQNLASATRDQRAVRTTLEEDFKHMAPDGPCLIITNKAVAAFRSREDEQGQAGLLNGSGNPVGADPLRQDLNGDGFAIRGGTGAELVPAGATFVPGEYATPATPGSRIRRVDTITFFVRRPGMNRQTSNYDASMNMVDMIGSTIASEAMVTYGHLRLPDNATTPASAAFFEPGEPNKTNGRNAANDNNRYYTQWVLGRSAMLMVSPNAIPATESKFTGVERDGTNLVSLTPLSLHTNTAGGAGNAVNGATPIGSYDGGPCDSLIDLAAVSIPEFSAKLARYTRDVEKGAASYNLATVNSGRWYLPAESTSYDDTGAPNTTPTRETLSYRANGNPFGARGSLNDLAFTLSQSSPVLVPRCTSFIVEFAGDFITQDDAPVVGGGRNYDWGRATQAIPDGTVDFVVMNGQRRVRWYGLPRYDNGGSVITTGSDSGPAVRGRISVGGNNTNIVYGEQPTNPHNENVSEVVPVSDLLMNALNAGPARNALGVASFEKVIMTNQVVAPNPPAAPLTPTFYNLAYASNSLTPTTALGLANSLPVSENYADPGQLNPFTLARANYVCAWQGTDNKPKLIRITLTLEDVKSRNGIEQTYQYVFPVQ